MSNMKDSDDLDWPLVGETVRMIQVSAGQIDMAMQDGNESVEVLSNSFTSMMGATKEIEKVASAAGFDENSEIMQQCQMVAGQMQSTVVAFQFYDKLAQRLHHVVDGLGWLSELISDDDRVHNDNEWVGLQGRIRKSYSMQEEQEMFDALLNGASLEEALALGRAALEKMEDDVELF